MSAITACAWTRAGQQQGQETWERSQVGLFLAREHWAHDSSSLYLNFLACQEEPETDDGLSPVLPVSLLEPGSSCSVVKMRAPSLRTRKVQTSHLMTLSTCPSLGPKSLPQLRQNNGVDAVGLSCLHTPRQPLPRP